MKFNCTFWFKKFREGTTVEIHNTHGSLDLNITTHTKWSGRTWHQDKMILWRGRRFMKSHCADFDHNKARELFGHFVIYSRRNITSRQFARCLRCGLERSGADEMNGYPCKEPKQYYKVAQ